MHLVRAPFGRALVLAVLVAGASWLGRPAEDEPEPHRVVVTETETTILDVIEFAPGTATILARSTPTLDAVAATLQGNPSLELVEVQAHTRGTGDETANLALSQRRADAVVAYLVRTGGVDPRRLDAQGYGDTQPIDRAAPSKNERICFLIVKRDSSP